jgi:hypothetical protein
VCTSKWLRGSTSILKKKNSSCEYKDLYISVIYYNLDMEENNMIEKKKEEPVYEKLEPNACMIISRDDKGVLVACNKDGDVKLKRVLYPTSEE